MKAFVKVNNGTFPNLNFYLAWEALTFMGYEVTLFEEKDLATLDITPGTPVFAGVKIFRQVIDKLGIDYPEFDCYPKVLNPYYGRTIRVSTVGEERAKFDKNPIPVFVKPVKPKQFIGNVWSSILNLIPLANIPNETPCYVCEPIDIVSEFRVYVLDGEILGVKHYYGDWSIIPDKAFIKEVVKNYKPCPIAYGVDIGVTKDGASFVIEANDGCNLGNYGLDYIHFGEMLVNRWFEIMGAHAAAEGIKADLEKFKDNPYAQKPGGTMERLRSKDYRELMTKVLSKEAQTKSTKSFGEEVQRRLKESEEATESLGTKIKMIPRVNTSGSYDASNVQLVATEINYDAKTPEVYLSAPTFPLVSGYMKHLIGTFRIDRDEYWRLTDAERQALHDKHDPGSKAAQFNPMFAEKYGKNPEGPF